MIINGTDLLVAAPIRDMLVRKHRDAAFSYGLSEVGYDIRVKQKLEWHPPQPLKALSLSRNQYAMAQEDFEKLFLRLFHGWTRTIDPVTGERVEKIGRTILCSSVEEFQIPEDLWCEFRNKSTHARRFCDFTLGTDGEPGWVRPGKRGFLTIEGVFNDLEPLVIPAGSGILKAVFHEIKNPVVYEGKYADQGDHPVPAILVDAP